MRGWLVRAGAALLGLGLVVGTAVPAGAAPYRSWPVTAESLGSLYGSVDAGGIASLRIWGSAPWCYVQPNPDSDIAANLDHLLAPSLDAVASGGGGTAIVTIGHPAPWVFENHPKAVRSTKLWTCGNNASSVSIPSLKSLSPGSVQWQRWATYVGAVSDWLSIRYAGRLRIVLETWNEPNLSSGLNPKLGVPGAAHTATEAAKSLHRYESIARDVLAGRGTLGWISIGSSAVFTRSNAFSKAYLSAHNRDRRIDSVHFNIYSFSERTPTSAVIDWDQRAASVRKRLRGYRALRNLPAYVTEANINLANAAKNRTNLKAAFTNPAEQRRMATATQMNAYFQGFSAVFWLIPWGQQQAAVYVRTEPGNVARDALTVLQGALAGRQFVGCSSKRGVRTCRFVDPATGHVARVLWRNSGSSTVKVGGGELLEVTGAVRAAGAKERIGTTPIVLR